ncbi:MAG TPA: integration host factor subunit alpha [Clostridiales bacterium]|nr:integration host factor subunit alpha [Clostridiales bacterium]
MNKGELVISVANRAGMTRKLAEEAVTAVFDSITDALAAGDRVALAGFGSFEVRERAARIGRNPQTGEEIRIEAARVPAFRPGQPLKDRVAG